MSVAVIIPCFNREAMIGEAVESCRGEAEQIIVVDDGSTDRSAGVAGAIGGVTLIRQTNKGVSAARNAGLRAVTQPFVRFLDSDDRMIPGSSAKLLSADFGPRQIAFGEASDPGYGFASAPPGPLNRQTLTSGTLSSWLCLFPRDATPTFDERLTISEDLELAVRLSAAGYEFVKVPVPVVDNRHHDGPRLSRDYGAAGYRAQILAYQIAGTHLSAPDARATLGSLVWNLGRAAARDRLRPEADSLFRLAKSLGASPYPLPYRAERTLEIVKRLMTF